METIAKIVLLLSTVVAITTAMPAGKFTMPASCAESDYCTEKHDLYPQELVDRLLKTSNFSFSDERPSLVDRLDDEDDENDCEVYFTDDPIYEIVDAEGNVRVVLQAHSGLRQVLDIKWCVKPGHIDYATMHFSQEFVSMNNLYCVEQKLDYSFFVLTKDWEGVEMVKSKTGIPVGCDCKLYENFDDENDV